MPSILMIDDDKVFRSILRGALAAKGYEVIEAEDAFEAQEVLKTLEPDLIMLDLRMPKMDGIELLRNLRELYELKDVPVLIVSQDSNFEHISDGFELGIRGYIVKSELTNEQIVARVVGVLESPE